MEHDNWARRDWLLVHAILAARPLHCIPPSQLYASSVCATPKVAETRMRKLAETGPVGGRSRFGSWLRTWGRVPIMWLWPPYAPGKAELAQASFEGPDSSESDVEQLLVRSVRGLTRLALCWSGHGGQRVRAGHGHAIRPTAHRRWLRHEP